ncbi:transposable element Tcb2 transposase [Trichonephila clavipes]|nr:transposable element Tcb2 transposase [Trichonephila clavipes]
MLWGRQVAGRNYPPTNKNTLIRALTEEWDKLPQQLLDNVVQSMRPDHRDENCRLDDVPRYCPGRSFECAVRNCWEQWTREGTHARKTGSGATRKTTKERDRRIVRQAHVDPTVTRSTIRADVGVAIVPQTISRHLAEANLRSKRPFRALPLTRNIGNCVFSGAKPDQCGMPQIVKMLCLVMNPGPFLNGLPGAIFQQDNARPHTARVAQDFLRHIQTLPLPAGSPNLPSVVHVWDQLKRQMLSCHSVHDLELDVQDLWAHLPQDNIRCLINSMPDRVAVCITVGGGPTRY